MVHLLKKEISSLFSSFVAYSITVIFLITSGLFLWVFPDSSILEFGYAGLESFFNIAPYLCMFLVSAITMRMIAAERKEGTFELLSTLPVSDWQIILAKYFGSLTVVFFAMVPTGVYYFTVYRLGVIPGNVDTGAVIGSYAGLFLLSSAFAAIGIFSSSLTTNQVVAFAISVFLSFFMFSGFDSAGKILSLQSIETTITAIGMNEHYESMSRGVIDTRDLTYFISCITVFLLLTKTILGSRKW